MNLMLGALAFALICIAAAYFQWQENKKLENQLKPLMHTPKAREAVIKLAQSRSVLIVLLLAACGAITISLAWKLNDVQAQQAETLQTLEKAKAALETTQERLNKKAQREARGQNKQSASAGSLVVKNPKPGAKKPQKPTSPISDIFDPLSTPDAEGGEPNALDAIKKRYEGLFVSYLFHKRCERATEDDFNILTKILRKETMYLDTPENFQADIIDAAKGSYREVYARLECDDAGGMENAEKFREFINQLHKQDEYP